MGAFLGKVLGAMAPKLLEWIFKGAYSLWQWAYEKWEHSDKVNDRLDEVDKQKQALLDAINEAYDGNKPTAEQKKKITRAFHELVRDY